MNRNIQYALLPLLATLGSIIALPASARMITKSRTYTRPIDATSVASSYGKVTIPEPFGSWTYTIIAVPDDGSDPEDWHYDSATSSSFGKDLSSGETSYSFSDSFSIIATNDGTSTELIGFQVTLEAYGWINPPTAYYSGYEADSTISLGPGEADGGAPNYGDLDLFDYDDSGTCFCTTDFVAPGGFADFGGSCSGHGQAPHTY